MIDKFYMLIQYISCGDFGKKKKKKTGFTLLTSLAECMNTKQK